MTYGIVLLKGRPEKRDDTETLLSNLKDDKEFCQKYDVAIEEVFKCFGWPDFVVIFRTINIERMMQALVDIRRRAHESHEDLLETTTLVCTTRDESESKKKEFSRKYSQFGKS
ncbi:MAG: hypothetical protein HXS54_16545 [Theionarchaea archaeon]|nr:hypothetical protein [Theionarchaea archaeon]